MLRRSDVPVTVVEATAYPRHRVCGEFISGIAADDLARLGVADLFATAKRHVSTAWCEDGRIWFRGALPAPAYGLSRHFLDNALARRFLELGGVLRCGERHESDGEGTVWATGRRLSQGGWIGLKAHYANLELSADLEIHLEDGSYVGLTRVEDGKVNVCGLFRASKTEANLATACAAHGMRKLAGRLAEASVVDGSTKGVTHFALGWQKVVTDRVCIGDAAAMIPPFTGNGMAMALQSGIAASRHLADWSTGEMSWHEAGTCVKDEHRQLFGRRLKWALFLQEILIRRASRRLALGLLASGHVRFETLYAKVR